VKALSQKVSKGQHVIFQGHKDFFRAVATHGHFASIANLLLKMIE
jgi:hypothetical protein